MSLSGRLKLAIRGLGADEFDYSLSDEDIAHLSDFLREVDLLWELPIVQAGVPASYGVEWKDGEVVLLDWSLPPVEEIAALLHRLRPFILTNEPYSFDRVCGVLGKRLRRPFVLRLLKEARELYSGKRMQTRIQILSQEILLNSETTLMNWLNSHEYHRDKDKAAELDRLHKVFPLESSKAIFVLLLSDKLEALAETADLVELILGKREHLRVDLCSA
jgi:hypothetical protein